MDFRIKQVMKERKITAVWLADQIGITRPNVSNIVSGKQLPSLGTLEKIAAALNVPVIELFEQPATGQIICPKCGTSIELTAKSKD